MGRKKTVYKYWELPQWEMAVLDVTDTMMRNNYPFITLMDGKNRYIIRVPKREGWSKLKQGDKTVVTKHLQREKLAYLELVKVEIP